MHTMAKLASHLQAGVPAQAEEQWMGAGAGCGKRAAGQDFLPLSHLRQRYSSGKYPCSKDVSAPHWPASIELGKENRGSALNVNGKLSESCSAIWRRNRMGLTVLQHGDADITQGSRYTFLEGA